MRTGDSGMSHHGQVLDATSGHSGGEYAHGSSSRVLPREGDAPAEPRAGEHVLTQDWLGRSFALPSLVWLILIAGLWLWLAGPALAAEPMQAFVEGLRDRGYYDTALSYIDLMEQQGKLPAELKQLLPYERAQTLLSSARDLNNVDAQRQRLDAAEAAFQQFAKAAPDHPLAAQANTWRGRILFEKARVEIFEAEDPSQASNRLGLQAKARALLTEARKVLDAAVAQNKKAFEKFPSFIPEGEKPLQEARAKAENAYIEVLFDAIKCGYWEARTYDRGSPSATGALQKASVEFTEMHDRYRNNTGGKFARLWQGKCFEEMDQITQALGVYDDVLALTPDTPVKAALYDLSLRFKLICLNHEQKKDYHLVVTLAEEWMNTAKGRTRSEVGYGILWELCRALEKIGTDPNRPEGERAPALSQALARARTLSRAAGEFKAPANAMIQRLLLAMNRSVDDPTDFDSAFGMAGKLSDDIRKLTEQYNSERAAGHSAEAKAKEAQLKSTAAEMTRMSGLALRFARPTTDVAQVGRAGELLAYGYLLDDRTLEAAAVGEYLMQTLAVRSPERAKSGGLIAMAAFDQAYKKAEKGKRDFETRKLIEFASRLEQKFPESDQANGARLAVARVMWDERKIDEAAAWWNKVPPSATHYAGAQLTTGQAYWIQYTSQLGLSAEKRPAKEKLTEWREAAIRHLEIGIAEKMRTTPAQAPSPDDLILGKVTLALIRNLSGVYRTEGMTTGAIELLTTEPHSVVSAIAVPEGTPRPKTGGSPKSRAMASFAYQQLLKAQIGVKDLDAARDARLKLEEVAGTDDAEALTQVFVEFGQELQKELKQLEDAGETIRADEVREGFKSFLNDLLTRQEGQNFTSLFWIAETFTSLAESSNEDHGKSQAFFAKAADAYLKIVEKAKSDTAFAQPDQLLYSRMRLMNCKQGQGDYVAGEQILKELLKNKQAVDSPNVQFAAASLYQAWARNAEPDAWKKYELAIQGSKSPVIWGWAITAKKLERVRRTKSDPRLEALEYDARYNLGVCQLALARQQSIPADRTKTLDNAKRDVQMFARINKSFMPDQYERFNTLFRDIMQEKGELPIDLPLGGGEAAPEKVKPGPHGAKPPVEADPAAEVAPVDEVKPKPAAQTNYVMIVLLGLVGAGAVGGILWLTRKPPNRYTSIISGESMVAATVREPEVEIEFDGPSEPQPPPPADPAPKPKATRLPGKPKTGPS